MTASNSAVHSSRPVQPADALGVLRELFQVAFWLAPAKKAIPGKKLPIAKGLVQPRASSNPVTAQVSRIVKGLTKMGDKRPEKLKSFLRHLESMLGKGTQPSAVQEAVSELEKAGLIQITGDRVSYVG